MEENQEEQPLAGCSSAELQPEGRSPPIVIDVSISDSSLRVSLIAKRSGKGMSTNALPTVTINITSKTCKVLTFQPSALVLYPGEESQMSISYTGGYRRNKAIIVADVLMAIQSFATVIFDSGYLPPPSIDLGASVIPVAWPINTVTPPARPSRTIITPGPYDPVPPKGPYGIIRRLLGEPRRAAVVDSKVRGFPVKSSSTVLSWRATRIGQASVQTMQLVNVGKRALKVNAAISNEVGVDDNAPTFSLVANSPSMFQMDAGEKRLFRIQFLPTSSGLKTANFTMTLEDGTQERIHLFGSGGIGLIEFGLPVKTDYGMTYLRLIRDIYAPTPSTFTCFLLLVNNGDAPAYYTMQISFTWPMRDVQRGMVMPPRGILAAHDSQFARVEVTLAADDAPRHVVDPLIGSIRVLIADAASCARASRLMEADRVGNPHSRSDHGARGALRSWLRPGLALYRNAHPLLDSFHEPQETLEILAKDVGESRLNLILNTN